MITKGNMRSCGRFCRAAIIIFISLFFISMSASAAAGITMTKSVSVVPNNGGSAYEGSVLTSRFDITNTGDVDFDSVVVVDTRNYPYSTSGSTDTINSGPLAHGASVTLYSTTGYTADEQDITYLAGMENTARVDGYVGAVSQAHYTDSENVNIYYQTGLQVSKATSPNPSYAHIGDDVIYTRIPNNLQSSH